jgi:hypothetical protein
MILPVDFEERVKRPKSNNGGDYPYAIKARDLMKNFVFSALDADDTLVDTITGQGGHPQRKLKIPAVPSGGTYVLGVVDGTIQWIATEECA